MTETKIFGHRGSMGTYPENTLLGFREAIRQGVDGLELDVHMTKDGEIVVIHDESLDRTTDGSGNIKDLLLDEIKTYSAGINYSHFPAYDADSWNSMKVPTLEEVLKLLRPYDIELNIELKTYIYNYPGMEEKLLSIVKAYSNRLKVIYSSFHLPSILRIKELDNTANIAWLLDECISLPKDYMETLQLEGLHLSKNILLKHPHHWKDLYNHLRIWTANNRNEIKQLLDLKVNAIVTDFPEKALFYRSERKLFV
ncbi:glycerophosphodiester phosphodiesterase [Oceanobacillus damuensis]|uniref:glycerophosphodiester phosphodiesterase n=1 Tax=Oceanobacillus damuensis TaxID=937928 RepID=UPI00082FFFDE|nr:glycerophosphodiester phosphodiesterase [Oceanobacillus damuensis]